MAISNQLTSNQLTGVFSGDTPFDQYFRTQQDYDRWRHEQESRLRRGLQASDPREYANRWRADPTAQVAKDPPKKKKSNKLLLLT